MSALLAIRGLSHGPAGTGGPALRGLDLDLAPGEILAVTGPSGTGKSILIRILAGLLREYRGTVHFRGRELDEWSRDYYERVGVRLEEPGHLLKLSARENLRHHARLHAGEAWDADALLDRLGLEAARETPVAGYTPEMLSVLALARALLIKTEALFLDHPLRDLGPERRARAADLLQERRDAGCGILLTVREAADAPFADRSVSLAAPGGKPA